MKLHELIEDFIGCLNRRRFASADLLDFVVDRLGRDAYEEIGGYRRFAVEIQSLVAQGTIRPVLASKVNGLNPPLYVRYQHLAKDKPLEMELRKHVLTHYHPALNPRYFLEHPEEFHRDRPRIDAIDAYLKRRDALPASVNERSFSLFGDEKFLATPHGQSLLQRLGIDLDRLNCYPTYEPFFYFALPAAPVNDVLVIENKDTFFTLKKLFQEGRHRLEGLDFRLLIYGEGHKIERSFAFFSEVIEFRGRQNRFRYFGDLDPEGITIFERLTAVYPDYDLEPLVAFYEALLERAAWAPHLRTKQVTREEHLARFFGRFSAASARQMQELLATGRYLPQEALDYAWFARRLRG